MESLLNPNAAEKRLERFEIRYPDTGTIEHCSSWEDAFNNRRVGTIIFDSMAKVNDPRLWQLDDTGVWRIVKRCRVRKPKGSKLRELEPSKEEQLDLFKTLFANEGGNNGK